LADAHEAHRMKSLVLFAIGAMTLAAARLDRRRFRGLKNPDLPLMRQPSAAEQADLIKGKSAWVLEVLAGLFFLSGTIALFQ
jgi:hypothetical protein